MENHLAKAQPLKHTPKSARQYYQRRNISQYTLPIVEKFKEKNSYIIGTFYSKKLFQAKNRIQKENYLTLSQNDYFKIENSHQISREVSQNSHSQKIQIQQTFQKTYAYGNAFRSRKVSNSVRKKSECKVQNIQQLNVISYGKTISVPEKKKIQFKSQKKYRAFNKSKKNQNEQTILIKISAPKMHAKTPKTTNSTINWNKTIEIQQIQTQYQLSSPKDVRKNSICPWELNQELFF